MKLIYLSDSRVPTEKAHGYQICKMCEEFASIGIEVELWIPTRKNNIKEDAFSFYGINSNFNIRKIRSFDFFKYWKYLGGLSFWLQNFWFAIKLFLVKTDKDAIIYTRDPEISWVFSLRGYRTVFEAHNWPNKNWLYKFLIKKVDKIITITHSLKELFLNEGWLKNKILVASDGVDLEKFNINLTKERAREKLNLPWDKKIIMYTGHLYEWKGAEDLARAATFLKDDNLIIFVGGTENDVNSFREKNKRLIENNKIIVTGHQAHSLIPIWLKSADILALPNRGQEKISKYYTSPLKLFEYMASKRPVVASDLPSIKEIMNEKNCVFFQSGNIKDLAEKITFLLENKNMADKISEQAYFDVKNFTWERRAKNIINFIK